MISAQLSADDLRPLYVEIRELAQGGAGGTAFSYRVRLPPRIAFRQSLCGL